MNKIEYINPVKFKIIYGVQVYINEDGNFYTTHPEFTCTTFKEISNLLKVSLEQKTCKTDINIIVNSKINGDNHYVVGKLYEIEYTEDNEVLIIRFKYDNLDIRGYLNPNRKTDYDTYLVYYIYDISNNISIDNDIEILIYENKIIDSICEKLNKNSIERINLISKQIENSRQYGTYVNLSKSFEDFIYIKN